MSGEMTRPPAGNDPSPFERIRRVNAAGNEHWSSRDFAKVLGYSDYRNFEQVIDKAKIACFNSGQRIEDHFVDITEMIGIGKGGDGRKKEAGDIGSKGRADRPHGMEPSFVHQLPRILSSASVWGNNRGRLRSGSLGNSGDGRPSTALTTGR